MGRTIGSKNKTTINNCDCDDWKKYCKVYYETNKEKQIAYGKAYYEANKEKRRKQAKAYYEANKGKIIADMKAYYQAKKNKPKEDDNEEVIVFKGWRNETYEKMSDVE